MGFTAMNKRLELQVVTMRYFALFFIFTIAGCASPPKSINEFYNGKYAIQKLESNLSAKKTHELLFAELVGCYQRETSSFIPIPSVSSIVLVKQATYVEYNMLNNGIRQLALVGEAGWNRFYQQLIEIESAGSESASVHVYEISSGWQKHTNRIRKWLKGEKAEGCGDW